MPITIVDKIQSPHEAAGVAQRSEEAGAELVNICYDPASRQWCVFLRLDDITVRYAVERALNRPIL